MNRLTVFVALALLAGAPCANAELYKWVDENGVVHFSQTPPENRQAAEVEAPGSDPAATRGVGEGVYSDAIEQTRARNAERAAEKAREKQERLGQEPGLAADAGRCSNARYRLKTLRRQCPVFIDGAGVMRDYCPGVVVYIGDDWTFIPDSERSGMIDHYADIVANCDAPGR